MGWPSWIIDHMLQLPSMAEERAVSPKTALHFLQAHQHYSDKPRGGVVTNRGWTRVAMDVEDGVILTRDWMEGKG